VKRTSDIRTQSVTESKEKLAEMRKELAKQKAVLASGTRPENPGNIKLLKKNIARTLTILREKELVKTKKQITEVKE